MKKFITLTIAALVMAAASLLPVAVPTYALSAPGNAVCSGAGLAGSDCNGATGANQINKVVAFVINLISIVIGIAAVIMIILGGAKFITSGGDPSKVAGAKASVMYAIIGLVIVAAAQLIVHYVLSNTK